MQILIAKKLYLSANKQNIQTGFISNTTINSAINSMLSLRSNKQRYYANGFTYVEQEFMYFMQT